MTTLAAATSGRETKAVFEMSDTPQGTDWWLASDGKWYPPQSSTPPPPPATTPAPQQIYVQQPVVMSAAVPTDSFCITSLVCGIVGIVTFWLCGLGFIPGVIGLVFGVLGMKRVEDSRGTTQGRGMALAGAICGGIAVVLVLIWIVLYAIARNDANSYWN